MSYTTITISKIKYSKSEKGFVEDKPFKIDLDYEEMVEIFKEFRDKKSQSRFNGNEAHASAMHKAQIIFEQLPTTDY